MSKQNGLIRRNTAVLATSLVETRITDLARDEIGYGACLLSFNPEDPANESMIFKSEEPGSREWTQHTTEPFDLVNWIAKKVEIADVETGVISPGVRVVIFDPHGDTLAFVSVGICASLDLFRTLRGDGPYSPPIPVVVGQVKTRRGFSTLKLRPVNEPAAKVVKPSK